MDVILLLNHDGKSLLGLRKKFNCFYIKFLG
jgi:hypothetical protein